MVCQFCLFFSKNQLLALLIFLYILIIILLISAFYYFHHSPCFVFSLFFEYFRLELILLFLYFFNIFCYKFSIHIYLAVSRKFWYVAILLSFSSKYFHYFSWNLYLWAIWKWFISRYLWIFQINFCYCHSNLILLLCREDTLCGFSSFKFSNICLLAQDMVCLNAGLTGTSSIYIFCCP